jgi:hypothetical protein
VEFKVYNSLESTTKKKKGVTGPVFSSDRHWVVGSRKEISPNWSCSEEMATIGLASFSSLSNSRRTEA